MKLKRWFFFILLLLLIPLPLFAHEERRMASGFIAGFSHPISGLDHVLAMIAVGLWGAQLGAPALWLLPVTFPMMMALGGLLGLLGIPLPFVEIGIGISAFVLGILVALEKRLPTSVCILIVAFFAIFHGFAHGTELSQGTSAVAYSMGFVVSTGCLHGIGILIGSIHQWRTGRIALRVAGMIIAVSGLFFIFQAVV